MAKDNRGWHNESERHAAAARGEKTGHRTSSNMRRDARRILGMGDNQKPGRRYPEMDPDKPLPEKDINLIMRRINNDEDAQDDPCVQAFYANDEGWKLTEAQEEKGRKWLLKKKKHLGYREMDALQNMKEMRIVGTIPGERNDYQYPLYQVIGYESSFEYKVEGGEIYITG